MIPESVQFPKCWQDYSCFNLVPSSGQLGIMGGGLSVQLSVCVRQDQIHTGAGQEEALGFINNFIGSLP